MRYWGPLPVCRGSARRPDVDYQPVLRKVGSNRVFQRSAFMQAIQDIERRHRSAGTPVRVEPQISLDPKRGVVDVEPRIEPAATTPQQP
jgi:outer membrane protein assembly factor BamA